MLTVSSLLPFSLFSPEWDETTTAEELDRSEREAFMTWRRTLAEMEEAMGERQLTPFEKNLEVWRQLWRVLERSHIVVQILDARNPLLFRSKDLEAYVSELSEDKTCLLVINKADYLTPHARREWAAYFDAHGIDFVFWSAALEQARIEKAERARRRREQRHNYHGHTHDDDELETPVLYEADETGSDEEEEEQTQAKQKAGGKKTEDKAAPLKASSMWKDEEDAAGVEKLSLEQKDAAASSAATSSASSAATPASSSSAPARRSAASASRILTRDELFAYVIDKYVNSSPENRARYESGERITVGMTGYPNVGSWKQQYIQRTCMQRFSSHVQSFFGLPTNPLCFSFLLLLRR